MVVIKDVITKALSNDVNDSIVTNTPNTEIGCVVQCLSNVVSEKRLKKVQQNTLQSLKEYLSKTYGPMGSYTAIVSGNNAETIKTEYSKDGLKVLKNIFFNTPIELSLQSELRDVCQYVEKKIGDGTTSAVILSSLIYDELLKIIESEKIPQRKVVKEFNSIVDKCKDIIINQSQELTLEKIYDICMISTNGNEEVSKQIMDIYKEFGFNVNIDVDISNDANTKIKTYDGLTIDAGYSDPAYINNALTGTSTIRNPEIFAFQDPIDTPEMISYMEKIIIDNIFTPISENKEMVPTVIVAPVIGRDGSGVLTKLVTTMYEYDKRGYNNQKPPILIITNIHGTNEAIMMDITRLCNCKYIKKYIDPEVQKKEQESGDAVTMENIHSFAGTAEAVISDNQKSKFINPYDLISGNNTSYDMLVSYLESEINNAIANNEDKLAIGRLKKRLNCLKANMVDFLVGGISISDRDSLKDLVEDAVKNCSSAAVNGVGRAANFEGLNAIYNLLLNSNDDTTLEHKIIVAIFKAYWNAAKILYSTVIEEDKTDDIITSSLEYEKPFNVIDLFNSNDINVSDTSNVLCSIMTDVEILNAISKIITMMVTSNQCLLQSAELNRY